MMAEVKRIAPGYTQLGLARRGQWQSCMEHAGDVEFGTVAGVAKALAAFWPRTAVEAILKIVLSPSCVCLAADLAGKLASGEGHIAWTVTSHSRRSGHLGPGFCPPIKASA